MSRMLAPRRGAGSTRVSACYAERAVDETPFMEAVVGANRVASTASCVPKAGRRLRRGARDHHLAPGRAVRLDLDLRAMVRVRGGARGRHQGDARRPGRRRGARRLSLDLSLVPPDTDPPRPADGAREHGARNGSVLTGARVAEQLKRLAAVALPPRGARKPRRRAATVASRHWLAPRRSGRSLPDHGALELRERRSTVCRRSSTWRRSASC